MRSVMSPLRLSHVASMFGGKRPHDMACFTTQSACYSQLLDSLVNWEQKGIPKAAGTSESHAFDLNRMHRLLRQLGDPHMQWPAVHIAGSKGKGSTAALITEALRDAGYKVGAYTSPHLHHISERISTAAQEHISPGEFELLVKSHEDQITACREQEHGALSHFETVTALAFRHFADQKVDIAVIETGMGGLTDATNVISPSKLQLAVITALGFEHAEALGGSLQSIAAAKAGILKQGRPVVVSSQQHAEALQEVLLHAAASQCEVLQADELVSVEHRGYHIEQPASPHTSAVQELVQVSGTESASVSLSCGTSLVGPHQHSNIATAVAALTKLRALGWSISDESIKAGIERAYLPGRFQVLALPPSPGSSPSSTPPRYMVLDGAHTAESASALRSTLASVFPGLPVVLLLAMAADKEHRAVIEELRQISPKVVVFTSAAIAGSIQRTCAPGVLAAHWQAAAMMSRGGSRTRQLIQASLAAAVDKAKHELSAFAGPGVICVAGSLHAAAQAGKLLSEA